MIKNSISIILLTIGIFACKKSEDSTVSSSFDHTAFLVNAADNIIVPSYSNALASVKDLETATASFSSDPTDVNLENVQTKWKAAFVVWQSASPFNFGPADGTLKSLQELIATYPINTSLTETIILGEDYSFKDFNLDTRGFSAIGYLIHNGSNEEVLASFDRNRITYLTAIVADVVTRIDEVTTAWQGAYRDVFVSNTSTSAGGSISFYYNQFVISYESSKKYKLGFPAGLGAGQSGVQPELLEAYYGEFSLELVKAHFTAIENVWYGKSSEGKNGSGFDDFLEAVDGGAELKSQTISSLQNVRTKINAIPEGSLVETLNSDPSSVTSTVEEMQKHTRYFKSDLTTKIGIAITFSDGDGD